MYANYFPNAVLSAVNYISVIFASIMYAVVFGKFYQAHKVK
ncbi:hypothetical protein Ga0451573_003205 [Peptococcaceae bacterium DYL19]|nr:hypothetical protein [Phosphitispora fastidiosa]